MKIVQFICLFVGVSVFSQNKIVEYTQSDSQEKILHYFSNKGKEYARVYSSVNKEVTKRDSLVFENDFCIKQYTTFDKKHKISAVFDLENLIYEGEYLPLKCVNRMENWEDLLFDNQLIKDIIKERKIKPNDIISEKNIDLNYGIFLRLRGFCEGSGLPYGSNEHYEKISSAKIVFNSQKKPTKMILFLKGNGNYSDFFYIRQYFYKNHFINRINTTINYAIDQAKTYNYTENYEKYNINYR